MTTYFTRPGIRDRDIVTWISWESHEISHKSAIYVTIELLRTKFSNCVTVRLGNVNERQTKPLENSIRRPVNWISYMNEIPSHKEWGCLPFRKGLIIIHNIFFSLAIWTTRKSIHYYWYYGLWFEIMELFIMEMLWDLRIVLKLFKISIFYNFSKLSKVNLPQTHVYKPQRCI